MLEFKGTLDECYSQLVETLLAKEEIVNGTKEINNCCLTISNPTTKSMLFPYRKVSEKYSNAELKWYWSADNSCETIGQHASMWLKLSDDGKTNNSAYGYILFKKYGFDQLQQIISLLKRDPTSRRAVLNISDPSIDRINTKDMQCTIALQFLIRNGSLQETVYMRSNDVFFGFPYDYVFFVSIGEYIASKLNIEFTQYTHIATSLHMYLRDVEKFKPENTTLFSVDIEKIIKENYNEES